MSNLETDKALYYSYLELRSRGLRQQALSVMEEFIEKIHNWPKDEKREFINETWIKAFGEDDHGFYLPGNLNIKIFRQEIQLWLKEEPNNPIPLRWTFDFNLIKQAISQEPKDQITLKLLSKILIDWVEMNQHEISAGYPYNGDPREDIENILFMEQFIPNIEDIEFKQYVVANLKELKEIALLHREGIGTDRK